MSTKLIYFLMFQYGVLAVLSLYERKFGLTLYWTGAVMLNYGVILMQS